MENFNFKTMDKLPVLQIYKVKPKKFILSYILGSLITSIFILGYTFKLFTSRKNFLKYMLIMLDLFNSLLTLFFLGIYIRLSGISNRQSIRVIQFYFIYQCFYLILFFIYCIWFLLQCLDNKVKQVYKAAWETDDILLVFLPLFFIFILKMNQLTNYYYSLKQIESN